jgi:predicted nucleic acid-binding protein
MILAKILQGIKSPKEARLVRENLESLPFVETGRKIWQHAGEISATLRKKGHTIPLSDIIIASTAIIEGYEILTIDPHFDMIPGLILHKMTSS